MTVLEQLAQKLYFLFLFDVKRVIKNPDFKVNLSSIGFSSFLTDFKD